MTIPEGTVALNPDGTLSFTPNADFNGPVSFDYTVSDGTTPVSATVDITVTPVNDVPVAADDTLSAVEDTPLTGSLATNDTPSGDGGNVWAVATGPSNGTVTVGADGSFVYTPERQLQRSGRLHPTPSPTPMATSRPPPRRSTSRRSNDARWRPTTPCPPWKNTPCSRATWRATTPRRATVATSGRWPRARPTAPDGHGGRRRQLRSTPNATTTVRTASPTPSPDADGDISTATATINVAPTSDAPVAAPDTHDGRTRR